MSDLVRQSPLPGSFLSLISRPRGTSRVEIARATGFSLSRVGNLVRDLTRRGILVEGSTIETSRGRRPVLLRPAPSLGFLVGVDIGMAWFRAAITTAQGDVVASRVLPSPVLGSVDLAMEVMLAEVDALLFQENVTREQLLAVGVSNSARCDEETGECLYWHAAQQWKGLPLKDYFAKRYQVPIFVDDSVNCMALAEREFGDAIGEDNFFFLNAGYGVGGALFLNGGLYRGASGVAGEIGHVSILETGPQCTCGNFGCLEALASGRALMRFAQMYVAENVATTLRDGLTDTSNSAPIASLLTEAAEQGDRVARRLVRQTGQHLGVAVANLLNLLNPPLIVLGGGVIQAMGEMLEEDIIREASGRAFEIAFNRVRIIRSRLDTLGAARGAALLATKPVLERLILENGVG